MLVISGTFEVPSSTLIIIYSDYDLGGPIEPDERYAPSIAHSPDAGWVGSAMGGA